MSIKEQRASNELHIKNNMGFAKAKETRTHESRLK